MMNLNEMLPKVMEQAAAANVDPIRNFLFRNPGEPLIATGSGGTETVGDFAALLYGARGGVATSVSPYTLNSFCDEALRTSKVLLISKGGHNNDIIFATDRAMKVNPQKTAAINFNGGELNVARKSFVKAGSDKCFVVPMRGVSDGFVSSGTTVAY